MEFPYRHRPLQVWLGRHQAVRRRRSSSQARTWWYELYRRLRVNLRATMEAQADVAIYGFGMVRTNVRTGHVEHVPIAQALEIMEQQP